MVGRGLHHGLAVGELVTVVLGHRRQQHVGHQPPVERQLQGAIVTSKHAVRRVGVDPNRHDRAAKLVRPAGQCKLFRWAPDGGLAQLCKRLLVEREDEVRLGLDLTVEVVGQRRVVERHAAAKQILLQHRLGRDVGIPANQVFDKSGTGSFQAGSDTSTGHSGGAYARVWGMGALYDRIGRTYATTRRPDPRIQAAIFAALGDAETVVNVGAGTGSYEPPQTVLAVEPSAVMIAQRPPGSAPAVQATAEHIPLPDGACDAALASLTIHHWPDRPRGLAELRRVARRVVVFTVDPAYLRTFWFSRDYLPEGADRDLARFEPIEQVCEWMGGDVEVTPVPIPHDCVDGFFGAFWRRPAAYLDPAVRAGNSNFAGLDDATDRAVTRLAGDLESGVWRERNRELLDLDQLDLGYRLLASRPCLD